MPSPTTRSGRPGLRSAAISPGSVGAGRAGGLVAPPSGRCAFTGIAAAGVTRQRGPAGRRLYADALRVAADDVAAELVRLVENDIEGAPLRLLFPMLIGLLPPILVLTLYPPATALINSLTGAGSSGLIK